MDAPSGSKGKGGTEGNVLVAAQLICVAALAFTGPVLPGQPVLFAATIASGLVAVWSIAAVRPSNLRIHPEPRASTRLVTSGPYRAIRHPMYAALLLLCGAWLAADFSPPRAAIYFILAGVMVRKIVIEERALVAHFPEYAAYRARTRRLIPFIY